MKLLICVVLGIAALAACGDDGGNGQTPDTVIDNAPSGLSKETRVSILFHPLGDANTFLCRLDGGEIRECAPPFEADVTTGAHTFEVSAALNTNVDPTPALATWTVDAEPPDTTIASAPPALDNSLAPEFTFTGTDAQGAVTFECALDGAAFAACTSPASLVVVDGAHTFAVRAVDLAGNADPSPAQHTWAVDSTAPDTVITAGPADASTTNGSVAFVFESPDPTATFECQLDTGAFAACTSPQPYTGLADGSHTFAVRAIDASAIVDPSPATRTWTVDVTPPDVTITSHPTNPSNDTTPMFGFSSTDATATFECQIDAAAFVACTSPWTGPTITTGSHAFRVRATDPVGNVSAPATFAWVVDITPPDTSFVTTEPSPTNDATGDFTFASTPATGNTFECSLDGAAFTACTTPFATAALPDGSHTLAVRAVDAAGNADPSPATHTWIVDRTPPDTMIVSQPANPTNDPTGTFTFTATEPGTFQCAVDGAAFATCPTPFTTAALGNGNHTFAVRALDSVGNVDATPATYAWTVDTAPPDTTITVAEPNPTNDTTGDFEFTATEAGATFECRVDASAFTACTTPFSTGALAEGTHTFAVRAKDALGNTDPSADTHTWTIDLTPPDTAIGTRPANPSNDTTPTFTFTASPATGATFQCSTDMAAFTACTTPLTLTLAAGSHNFRVRALDALGNADATPATYAWVIDTTPPDTTITMAEPDPTADTTGDFQFTATETGATFQCSVDGAAFAACTSPFATAALGNGSHTFAVRATDLAGNVDATPATHAWTVDLSPPNTTITVAEPSPTNDPTGDFQFTSNEAGSTFQCSVDGAAFTACTTPFSTAALATGSHTFAVRAIDSLGNIDASPATHTWTVDLVAPNTNLTATEPSPTNDPTGDFTFTANEAGSTFQCSVDGAAFTACTTPFATAALGDGSHTFAVRATDPAGNTDATPATHTWTVDTTPPATTITIAEPTPTNDPTADFQFTSNETGSTFECSVDSGAFAACTTPFSTAALTAGTHTFAVRTIDPAGNVDASPATHTWVLDTTAPNTTLTSAEPSPTNDPTGDFTFTSNETGATFQCSVDGSAFATCTTPFATAALADGSHTIQVRARDAAGNVDPTPATHTWTVDTTPPIVSFTRAPPANWPVNYFDFIWTANETVTYTCALDGAAPAACNPATYPELTFSYAAHTFRVEATDAAGNVGSGVRSWTSTPGLVLHYPWEQGATKNTSLLAQVPFYSPDSTTAAIPNLGGWAGTAAGHSVPSHTYVATSKPILSGTAQTLSVWVRTTDSSSGSHTIASNLTTSGGFRLSLEGSSQLTVTTTAGSTSQSIFEDRWVHVALQLQSTSITLYVNGLPVQSVGYSGAAQAANLTVGPTNNVDLDDLRIYNTSFSAAAMCTTIARGIAYVASPPSCIVLTPGYEFDFEQITSDTGSYNSGRPFSMNTFPVGSFVPYTLGDAFQFSQAGLSIRGMKVFAGNTTSFSKTVTFWYDATATGSDTLFDGRQGCTPGPTCGLYVSYSGSTLTVFAGTPQGSDTRSVTATGWTNVVIAERRTGVATTSLRVYVNGTLRTTLTLPATSTTDLFNASNDTTQLPSFGVVDELEIWPMDLSASAEILCENGFDGEWNPATNSCTLTSL